MSSARAAVPTPSSSSNAATRHEGPDGFWEDLLQEVRSNFIKLIVDIGVLQMNDEGCPLFPAHEDIDLTTSSPRGRIQQASKSQHLEMILL
jgi:hypothetical protein